MENSVNKEKLNIANFLTDNESSSIKLNSLQLNGVLSYENIKELEGDTLVLRGTTTGVAKGEIVTYTLNSKVYTAKVFANGNFKIEIPKEDLIELIPYENTWNYENGQTYVGEVSVTNKTGAIIKSTNTIVAIPEQIKVEDVISYEGETAIVNITLGDMLYKDEGTLYLNFIDKDAKFGEDIAKELYQYSTDGGVTWNKILDDKIPLKDKNINNVLVKFDVVDDRVYEDSEALNLEVKFNYLNYGTAYVSSSTIDILNKLTSSIELKALPLNSVLSYENIKEIEGDSLILRGTTTGVAKGEIVTYTLNSKEYTAKVFANGNFKIEIPKEDLAELIPYKNTWEYENGQTYVGEVSVTNKVGDVIKSINTIVAIPEKIVVEDIVSYEGETAIINITLGNIIHKELGTLYLNFIDKDATFGEDIAKELYQYSTDGGVTWSDIRNDKIDIDDKSIDNVLVKFDVVDDRVYEDSEALDLEVKFNYLNYGTAYQTTSSVEILNGSSDVLIDEGINRAKNSDIYTYSDGSYLVAWQAYDSSYYDPYEEGFMSTFGIYAQKFDENGNKVSDKFLVNTIKEENQTNPKIIELSDGKTLITWENGSDDYANSSSVLKAQIIDTNSLEKIGTQIGFGDISFDIFNTYNYSSKDYDIAQTKEGFIVVYSSDIYDSTASNIYKLYAQRFDNNGLKIGEPVLVHDDLGNEKEPKVEYINNKVIITWTNELGKEQSILRKEYLLEDTLVEHKQTETVNEYVKADIVQNDSSISKLIDGSYIVSWTKTIGYYDTDIYAQKYDVNGEKIGGEILVNTHTLNTQQNSEIVGLSNGDFVAVWSSYNQDGSYHGIFMQRFNSNGEKLGLEEQVNYENEGSQYLPKISSFDDGFAISWTQEKLGRNEIFTKKYDNEGNPYISSKSEEVLVLEDVHSDIDFETLAALNDEIKTINLSNNDYFVKNIKLEDVLTISDKTNELIFEGENKDTIELSNSNEWLKTENTKNINGKEGEFIEYVHQQNPTAKLFVDEDISVI